MAKDNQENRTSFYEKKRGLKRYTQSFDKYKITLTKAGVTFNVYDKIQDAREDTEIIPTLKKYGCIPVQGYDSEALYQDFTQAQDLRGVLDRKIAAENAFYQLPIEVRREFDNNIDRFMKDGEKYLKNKIEQEKQQNVVSEQPSEPQNVVSGEQNNG